MQRLNKQQRELDELKEEVDQLRVQLASLQVERAIHKKRTEGLELIDNE